MKLLMVTTLASLLSARALGSPLGTTGLLVDGPLSPVLGEGQTEATAVGSEGAAGVTTVSGQQTTGVAAGAATTPLEGDGMTTSYPVPETTLESSTVAGAAENATLDALGGEETNATLVEAVNATEAVSGGIFSSLLAALSGNANLASQNETMSADSNNATEMASEEANSTIVTTEVPSNATQFEEGEGILLSALSEGNAMLTNATLEADVVDGDARVLSESLLSGRLQPNDGAGGCCGADSRKEWRECGPACPESCLASGEACEEGGCVQGCFCASPFVLLDGADGNSSCVKRAECGLIARLRCPGAE